MATFNQQNQQVTTQYNAETINFGAVQTPQDLVTQLEKLKAEIAKAKAANVISEEEATDAEYQVTKAAQQAAKPEPDKNSIVANLNTAKEVVQSVAGAGGLVAALAGAVDTVARLFSWVPMTKKVR